MPGLRERLTYGLADRYRIGKELGRGGMATVFVARDLKHGRDVALKVLHPELGASIGAERFRQEIQIAAQLTHPHILPLHDSGEVPSGEDRAPDLWYTMPFVEGESLRERLQRERSLPVDVAIGITREVAGALDYAHRHGIVHRDIKPENILLVEGHALIADFGIARALGATDAGVARQALTGTGLALGTPGYMSPEQLTGEMQIDGRADIFALGCVFYEMLAGAPPFEGPNPQAVLFRAMTDDPPPLRDRRPGLPPSLEQVVIKAMHRDREDRYPSAGQFLQALTTGENALPGDGARLGPMRRLKRAWPLALGVMIVAAAVVWIVRRPPSTGDSIPRLAVLPFEIRGDTADAYFAEGLTDEIRGVLAGIPKLLVVGRTSSEQYRRTTKESRQIAKELQVDYLLSARVEFQTDAGGVRHVRVSPELIEASSGTIRWRQPVEENVADAWKVRGQLATRVAGALGVFLSPGNARSLSLASTRDPAAYDAWLRGKEAFGMFGMNPKGLSAALRFFRTAVEHDSGFADAWADRSRAASRLFAAPDSALAVEALQSARRALALAPERAGGHFALAEYNRRVIRDFPGAMLEYEQGLRMAPGDIQLVSMAVLNAMSLGRWAQALEFAERAEALDPRSAQAVGSRANVLFNLRRNVEALRASDREVALAPSEPVVVGGRISLFVALGDTAGARATYHAGRRVEGPELELSVFMLATFPWILSQPLQDSLMNALPDEHSVGRARWALIRARVYALRGDVSRARPFAESARSGLERAVATDSGDADAHAHLGLAFAYLGRAQDAVREGERAVALRPVSRDAFNAPGYVENLVRIDLLVGRNEDALSGIEALLRIPYTLTTRWLSVDPTFRPLRGNPRFEKLLKS